MDSQTNEEIRGPGKNKKKWTDTEDEKLIEAMLELLNSGTQYKTDNGFKPGFFLAIEKALAISIPGSGIKVKPHIESRIKTLKNDWATVYDMLSGDNTSGFGWDNETHVIDASQYVWDAYLAVHKKAAKWRGRKFKHYWDLCTVFGKDRETRKDVQTIADVIEEMDREKEVLGATGTFEEGLEEMYIDSTFTTGSTRTTPGPTSTRSEGCSSQLPPPKKRRHSGGTDPFLTSINEAAKIIGSKIEHAINSLSRVLGVDADLHELRKNINGELSKLPGISISERYKATSMLARDKDIMVVFFSIPDEEKAEWVKALLGGEI